MQLRLFYDYISWGIIITVCSCINYTILQYNNVLSEGACWSSSLFDLGSVSCEMLRLDDYYHSICYEFLYTLFPGVTVGFEFPVYNVTEGVPNVTKCILLSGTLERSVTVTVTVLMTGEAESEQISFIHTSMCIYMVYTFY